MLTPFEELEFLSEYLPEEGEAVVVSRRDGELHCDPVMAASLRDGIDDVELYGRLVQANERLNGQGALPLWLAGLGTIHFLVLLYSLTPLGWREWYLVPMAGVLALCGSFHWIRSRQRRLFREEIAPMLARETSLRGLSHYALLTGVRQHAEFRTLLDELIRWNPDRPRAR